jgi:hypothetical protein
MESASPKLAGRPSRPSNSNWALSPNPHLSLAQVHAALAYYWQHREQIDEEVRADDPLIAGLEERNGPVTSPS